MNQPLHLQVAGGDMRQWYAAQAFREFPALTVSTAGFSRLEAQEDTPSAPVDILVLPRLSSGKSTVAAPYGTAPLSLSNLLSSVRDGGLVLGGNLSDLTHRMPEDSPFTVCDYFQRAEFSLENAVPTAEGAIQIAMQRLPITIAESRVLIIGYGRIGSVLANRLLGLHARVTVAIRNPLAKAKCNAYGLETIQMEQLPVVLPFFDWVCNTAPAMCMDETALQELRADALLIDLASAPGGTDFTAAERLGRSVEWALALPGKVAPKTAGRIIANTVFQIAKERGFAYDNLAT